MNLARPATFPALRLPFTGRSRWPPGPLSTSQNSPTTQCTKSQSSCERDQADRSGQWERTRRVRQLLRSFRDCRLFLRCVGHGLRWGRWSRFGLNRRCRFSPGREWWNDDWHRAERLDVHFTKFEIVTERTESSGWPLNDGTGRADHFLELGVLELSGNLDPTADQRDVETTLTAARQFDRCARVRGRARPLRHARHGADRRVHENVLVVQSAMRAAFSFLSTIVGLVLKTADERDLTAMRPQIVDALGPSVRLNERRHTECQQPGRDCAT